MSVLTRWLRSVGRRPEPSGLEATTGDLAPQIARAHADLQMSRARWQDVERLAGRMENYAKQNHLGPLIERALGS